MKFISALLALAFSYLLSAFVQAELNSALWSMDARFFSAIGGVVAIVLILIGPADAFD